jgi:hypothetical protein
MRLVTKRTPFLMLTLVLFFGHPAATCGQGVPTPEGYQRANKLPARFLALVPQGYAIHSQQSVKYGNMANISFVANKQFTGHHSLYFSEYHLDLNIKESPSQLITLQAPMYRQKLEQDVEAKMISRGSDAITAYDPPQLTRYSWGAEVSQRVVHKYMGAGTAPDEVEYRCDYLGLIVSDRSIKIFKLSVSGAATRAEADGWAERVAKEIDKTGLANL